ncbi:MAG: serine kinase [Candidatus Eiseniibacteriota bacterium]|nr:MAG: serine kinase [Candidatus Eisenbacteria bacterium]
MKLKDVVDKLELKVLTCEDKVGAEVSGGYTSDLLSDVMANSKEGNLWITLQTHQNIVAVAKLKDLSGIVLVNERQPDVDTVQKATAEGVLLLQTSEPAFVISGKLYQLLGA